MVNTVEDSGILTAKEDEKTEKTANDEINGENKRKKRRRRFTPSVNIPALKALEGVTTSSFVELVRAVILIDGKPYSAKSAPLSKNRQETFKRLIEHYAVLERVGERQYYIKIVYSDKQIAELREARVSAIKDKSII